MKAEQIDLTTAKKGDRFLRRDGSTVTYLSINDHVDYPHLCFIEGQEVYPTSFTNEGKFIYTKKESEFDILHTVLEEESAQDTLNKRFLHLISEAVAMGEETSRNNSLTIELFNFLENRMGAAENSIDILMGERGDGKNSIISDAIDRIAKETITPQELLALGFTEEYQPPIDGCAGFIYYDFYMHGIDLLSNAISNEEPLYVFFENQHEIHNLRKLGDLITALNEL